MGELQTVYDDIDQRAPGERINAAAPRFFVDAMKKYIARNSIRTTAPEFAFYCACTWDAQKEWLTAENIDWAIQWIISELPFPRLPADTDWYKPCQEWHIQKRREAREAAEIEHRRRLALEKPREKPTPEQIKKVHDLVESVGKKLSTNRI